VERQGIRKICPVLKHHAMKTYGEVVVNPQVLMKGRHCHVVRIPPSQSKGPGSISRPADRLF
jgi:hypothetical protein